MSVAGGGLCVLQSPVRDMLELAILISSQNV